ncbi:MULTISPECIES: lysophospholipid acyltransferase family protein [Saccharothrix]|uniref:1-acyl-sn-glycerol-3-phosphate acyltransferase n=1 Tax=Saccharothrix yanglingensis TaxID=659496 RepID=A0ABU0X3G3_9PSEU|nr:MULTISPECIES: lysophospholipid acyltransferase family protein [Saccharothrix]MDQ2586248.1 1-acyl-sn-glycerol-3-phosphate acyltransferase [Saccharothrix yanglingensis]MDU0289416.1 lysophospholipid acyltransferase family protein [Saccharothrix longispora]
MPDRVYPPVIAAAKLMFRVLDLRIAREGTEHVPTTGGAVLASNHVSYLDFIFAGFGALPARRLVRFMAKHEVFKHPVSGPLMRGMHHIPVDRGAGQASYQQALTALRSGEVVGIFPEATISRSFTVKEVKSGAVRLAAEAGVPLLPTAVWGTQRLWTKGRPKSLTQRHVPITIVVGEPIEPTTDAALRTRVQELLDHAQKSYPESGEGQWWQPAHLGGTAPTPEEAARLDAPRGPSPA